MDGGIDTLQKTYINMDITHNKVHAKQLIYANKKSLSLANNDSIGFYFKVDTIYEAHLRIVPVCGGDAEIVLEKASVAPTAPTGVVPVYLRKYQKIATAAAKTKLYDSVTGGTFAEVWTVLVGGGTGGNAVGGSDGNEPELPLEEDTWYHLTITNRSGSGKIAAIEALWYEVNDSIPEGEDRDNPDLKIL